MLKLEVLALHYRLSDRELMKQAQVNVAYRLFLGLGCTSPLPYPTSLTYFRERVGAARMQEIFHVVHSQAHELGLVRNRLRLKDATHLLAHIAVPSTIRLVAETRSALLAALQPFAAERAAEETRRAEELRLASDDLPDAERLLRRVTHLRAILAWADAVPASAGFRAAAAARQDPLHAALALAHQVLADREAGATDKVISVHDPDARRGKHGAFFDGYLLDVAMDADSELLTALNVLPANGDEGADTAALIAQEEQAHGNDVAAVSLDGAGFRGPVLRELTDPAGLNLAVFTPPSTPAPPAGFPPERFALTVLDDRPTLTCPAGQTTTQHERNARDTGTKFRFSKKQCGGCALRGECLARPEAKSRTAIKNDYEPEYRAAQAQAQTPAYAEVRKQHPAIERKLAELVNRHDLRHARYRGRLKVWYQSGLTGVVVNLKRLVRLRFAPPRRRQGQCAPSGRG